MGNPKKAPEKSPTCLGVEYVGTLAHSSLSGMPVLRYCQVLFYLSGYVYDILCLFLVISIQFFAIINFCKGYNSYNLQWIIIKVDIVNIEFIKENIHISIIEPHVIKIRVIAPNSIIV